MSRSELWKGVAISFIIGVVFAVIGYHAIYFALEMVGTFGEGLGVDDRSRAIYSAAHKVVHLFAAACGLAIGWFHYKRNWTLFTIAVVAIIAGGSYGVLNMYGFTSANRVTVAAVKDASRSAAERSYQAARADLMGQIDWLQKTAVKEEGTERRRLLKEVDAKRKELSDLKPPVPTAETAISDPQANTLARLTGTSAEQWMIGVPLFLAVLLFLTESFSFIVVGHMAAAIVAMFAGYSATVSAKLETNSSKSSSGSEGSGGKDKSQDATVAETPANVIDFPARVASNSEQPETVAQPPPKVSSEEPRVPEPAPKVPSSPKSLKREKRIFREWFAAQPDGARWETDLAMAEAAGVTPGTVSRETRKLDGTKLQRVRNGRTVQTTKLAKRPVWKNGGAVHAFG